MTTYQIACTIGTTDTTAELGMEIWLDDQQLFSTNHVTDTKQLTFDFDEDEADHELRFIMKNKSIEHTSVDSEGNIVSDARLTIADVAFDEIQLGQIFVDQATYTHDFNGTRPETVDKFYGEMGCNGTVRLRFTTPIYLWLLEHM
jgi:riboflavin synthase